MSASCGSRHWSHPLAKLVAFYSRKAERRREQCEAVNRIVSRENFFYPGKVRRPEFPKLWPRGGGRLAATDNRHKTMRIRQPKQQQEQNAILLPNLLPNAVGQGVERNGCRTLRHRGSANQSGLSGSR